MINDNVAKDHIKLIILKLMHIQSVTLHTAKAFFEILFFGLMEVQQGYIIFKTAARPDLAGTTHIQNVATGCDRLFLYENIKTLYSYLLIVRTSILYFFNAINLLEINYIITKIYYIHY